MRGNKIRFSYLNTKKKKENKKDGGKIIKRFIFRLSQTCLNLW